MSVDELLESLRNGNWVYGINDEVGEMLVAAEDMCHRFNQLAPSDKENRHEILKGLLGEIGDRYVIHSPFHCDFGKNIYIGDNFTSNYNLTILDEAEVRIGENVFIGPNVGIYTITHAIDAEQRREGVMKALPVIIGDNVWICGSVTILPGVTIGDGAVIAAGSVVTKDVEPHSIVAGNPAVVRRVIDEKDIVDVRCHRGFQ